MAQNYIQPGNVLEVVAPSGGYTTGQAAKIGSLVLIALGSAAQGSPCEMATGGIWQVTKVAGTAWVTGDKLYWDDTAKNFTKTTTSNTAAGYAAADATSGATAGLILLKQIA